MKKSIALLLFGMSAISAFGQYSRSGCSYIGLGVGSGKLHGSVAGQELVFDKGTLDVKTKPIGMVSMISSYSRDDGFGYGLFGALSIGLTNSLRLNQKTGYSNYDGTWYKDFNMYVDLRFGGQLVYRVHAKEMLVGLRYFYHAIGDGLRAYYGNTDEGCAMGLFGAYKKFGVDLNFSSPKIPGVGITSNWNITELEFRYRGLRLDDSYSLYFGLRAEHSRHLLKTTLEPAKTIGNSLMLLVALGGNK